MFTLNLVTPERSLAKKIQVTEVSVPGHFGQLTILPGHSPVMTTLSEGVLSYKVAESEETVKAAISWGYCEVNPFGVEILAETAELPSQIDKQRAQETLKEAESKLAKIKELDAEEIEKLQRKVKRARARLAVV